MSRNVDSSRLLARIHRRYATVTRNIQIDDLEFPFTRIKDPDFVLDEACDVEDRREKLTGKRAPGEELHLPYWAELWDSALGLGQFMSANRAEVVARHRTVLDLGCGMGLAGAVAARLGFPEVTLVDFEPQALLFAKLNTLDCPGSIRIRRIDWRRQSIDERFDLILGSDVLYDRAQWEHLEPFWRDHLADEGEVLLAEPGRQTGELFIDWIRSRGWVLEQYSRRVEEADKTIRIFLIAPDAHKKSTVG